MTSKTLTKIAPATVVKSAPAANLSKHAGHGALQGKAAPQPLKLKQILIIDSGDGAFTDESIKVKPHKTQPGVMVFKCTDLGRLLTQLAASGIKPLQVIKGSKHHIAFVKQTDVANALTGGHGPAAFPAGTVTAKAIGGGPSKLLK